MLTRGSNTSNLISQQEVLKQANEQESVKIRGIYALNNHKEQERLSCILTRGFIQAISFHDEKFKSKKMSKQASKSGF